jgi:hypothetical protein
MEHENTNEDVYNEATIGDDNMSPVADDAVAPENNNTILKEIGSKWSQLSEHDLSHMKGKDDVVSCISAKYGHDKEQVTKEVDTLLKGRQM